MCHKARRGFHQKCAPLLGLDRVAAGVHWEASERKSARRAGLEPATYPFVKETLYPLELPAHVAYTPAVGTLSSRRAFR